MKTQMRFQKILMILTVIVGALGAVFALIFCSGAFNQLCQLDGEAVKGLDEFIEAVQSANDTLFVVGLIFVVISVLPLIAACQKRRNYYITNYIAIGIVLAFQLVFIIVAIVSTASVMQIYNGVDFTAAAGRYEALKLAVTYGAFSKTPWTPIFGYVLIALIAVDMVALVLNLVWKIKLMQGEKKLLEQGKKAESSEAAAEVV